MDPLSAVGLAGNIISIIDCSTKVVSRARQLYQSVTGATAENDELESLTKNLKALVNQIRNRPSETLQGDHPRLSHAKESALDNLARQCVQVANELLECLDSLKIKDGGRPLKTATQAVKTVWKQDRIDGLQRRLDRISKQLVDGANLELLDGINRRLREMAVENSRLEANRTQEIDQLRRDFNSAIEEIKANAKEDQVLGAWLVLPDTARRGQAYFAEQVILQSLRFSAVDSRHQSIPEEHSRTFLWIFQEDSSTKFVQWLEEEDGVYWISGKPGSGKSTLMKFVADHEQTKRHLQAWAGDKKLVTANFFFWSASSYRSQTSQQGLLRTILYQILRQCPELIQMAYSDQWIAMTSNGKVLKESRDELLTVPALLNTLRKISTFTASGMKFCFFIDGLDEYDGRPADIMELIDILKSFPNAKACVSSRPSNEFEDRFGSGSPWKLYIHDLTRHDILVYVEETLGQNSRFRQLQKEDPQCPDFVRSIAIDADGVFLWVFLVVRSLLDGLTNSDRIKDLQDRLHETPKDLKDYFGKILFFTENRYRSQTARMFAIAIHAHSDLPLMAYWVVDQENPRYSFECPAETPAKEVLVSRLDNMRRRLKVLSKGLLEVGESEPESFEKLLFGHSVSFLHRTVKDYLQTSEVQLMLQARSDDASDPDWEILNSLCALAKMVPWQDPSCCRGFGRCCLDVLWNTTHRLDQNPLFQVDLASMVEHLQSALTPAFEENRSYIQDRGWFVLRGDMQADLIVFIACFCFGLPRFVSQKVAQDPHICDKVADNVPIIAWLASFASATDSPVEPSQQGSLMSTLEILLAHGLDPNKKSDDRSQWRIILEALPVSDDSGKTKWFEAVKLLLKHGADFEQKCTYTTHGESERETKASELLRVCFDADQFGILEDIVKQRAIKAKKTRKISKKINHFKVWIRSKK